jgi:phage terminase small subunit
VDDVVGVHHCAHLTGAALARQGRHARQSVGVAVELVEPGLRDDVDLLFALRVDALHDPVHRGRLAGELVGRTVPHRLGARVCADELRLLEDYCREVDLVDRMEAEVRGAELLVAGSMGQPVIHPLVAELRQHRSTLVRMMSALGLPDDAEGAAAKAAKVSEQARAAAGARWARGA